MSTEINPVISFADLPNLRKEINEQFMSIMREEEGLLKYIQTGTRPFIGEDGKFYWMEDYVQGENDTLNNSAAVLAADTSFVVSNIDRFAVGMVIKWRNYLETMKITAVDDATSTVTVTRNYNSMGAVTSVADTSYIDIVNRPAVEGHRAHEVGGMAPGTEYNYYETFREDVPFTEKVAQAGQYGFPTPQAYIDYVAGNWLRRLRKRLAKAILFNDRVATTTSVGGTTRGVYTWLMQSDTNKDDLSGAAVTADDINDLIASVYDDDANINDIVIFTDMVGARTMAKFNTDLANQIVNVNRENRTTAGHTYKTAFDGDFKAAAQIGIIEDNIAQKGTFAAINMSKIKLWYPIEGMIDVWDSKPNDMSRKYQRMAMEMTAGLELRDHKYSHGLLYNGKLTV